MNHFANNSFPGPLLIHRYVQLSQNADWKNDGDYLDLSKSHFLQHILSQSTDKEETET